MPKGASRKDRGLPEKAPPKPKNTAAMKRGSNGQGMMAPLGMQEAYSPEKIKHLGDVMPCCGCLLGDTKDECTCYCHETARMVQRFKG